MAIPLKTPEEIIAMRAAGQLAADTLQFIAPHIQPGITTNELDRLCHDYIIAAKAIPAPLNYNGFPKSICTSVNHVVCHGIPNDKALKKGDIINMDITVIVNGYHGDTSAMFIVGEETSILATRLCQVAKEALYAGIQLVKPGATLGDIGAAIQAVTEKAGYAVVQEYCGHGIGAKFHEDPQILHYGKKGTGLALKEGMCFTIEPMINSGKRHISMLKDGWTVVTKDRSLSAQWEHTLLVTATGCEILTWRPDDTLPQVITHG